MENVNESVNGNENVSKKGMKKVSKNEEMEQMKAMILNLAQTVGVLTEQLKQVQQRPKPAPTPVHDEPIVEDVDVPEIHVDGLVAVKPKGTGQKYAKPGPYTYQILGVPGDEDDFALQAKKCMLLLSKAVEASETKSISEATAMAVLRKHQRFISDRQDAWHVFAYYRAKLQQAGFVVRKQKFGM